VKAPRLPRKIADDPAAAGLADELAARSEPLWNRGEFGATRVSLTPAVGAALKSAFSTGRVVRGIDAAEKVLAGEQRGLERVDRATGADRGGRVSRLVVLADDGSERFYRSVDFLLRRHEPRVLALRLDASQDALGSLVFGPEQVARLLLIQHKDAVAAVLLALAAAWRRT